MRSAKEHKVALQCWRKECSDPTTVLAALEKDAARLEYATEELKSDRGFMLQAVSVNGLVLQHAAPEWQADKEVVMAAMGQNMEAFRYAVRSVQDDSDVLLVATRQDPSFMEWYMTERAQLPSKLQLRLGLVVQK